SADQPVASDAVSRSSSARAAASSWLPVAAITAGNAAAAALRPDAVASISRASADRIGAASAIDDSQLFAWVARSALASAEMPRSGNVSAANRGARWTGSATSRRPPSGARPASVASAANRKLVAGTAYGGLGGGGGGGGGGGIDDNVRFTNAVR